MKSVFVVFAVVACTLFLRAEDRYPDFRERFAYADPAARTALASVHLPGTDEGRYYCVLDAQNRGDLAAAQSILDAWPVHNKKFFGTGNEFYDRALFRQKLLSADKDLAGTCEWLRLMLNAYSDCAKPGTSAGHCPAMFDPARLTTAALLKGPVRHLFGSAAGNLLAFTRADLSAEDERFLLGDAAGRESAFDCAGALRVLLSNQRRGAADERNIVNPAQLFPKMTRAQLDEFRAAVKGTPHEVEQNAAFIDAYLKTLEPSAAVDLVSNAAVRTARLEARVAFLRTLPPSQDARKAAALAELLEDRRCAGTYDAALFGEYLEIGLRTARAVLSRGQLLDAQIRMSVPDRQAALVTDYLEHLCKTAADRNRFAKLVDPSFVGRVWEESRLMAGEDVPGIAPSRVKEVSDRVEVTWLPQNPISFAADADVALDLRVKNAGKVQVDIYDVDMAAALRAGALDDTMALDGCHPTASRMLDFSAVQPLRRTVKRLEFPELKRPGFYIVECSGNGVRNRAVVRKGRLSVSTRVSAAGLAVTVRGDDGAVDKDAAVWMDGVLFKVGEDGAVALPFGGKTVAATRCVATSGRLAAAFTANRPAETYALALGGILDNESVIPGVTAQAVLRPALTVADGAPVPLALLENPVLEIRTMDGDARDAVETRPVVLSDVNALVCSFRVPPRTSAVAFVLRGTVRPVTGGDPVQLTACFSRCVAPRNGDTEIMDAYLRHGADGWRVELRGKNGEPFADHAFQFRATSLLTSSGELGEQTLSSDGTGVIRLGAPEKIAAFRVSGKWSWTVPSVERAETPAEMAVAVGGAFEFPALGAKGDDVRRDLSLLEVNAAGAFVRDCLDAAVTVKDAVIRIAGLAPGDYRFAWRALDGVEQQHDRVVTLHVLPAPGDQAAVRTEAAFGITSLAVRNGEAVVKILGVSPETRVHLFARRMALGPDPMETFAVPGGWEDPFVRDAPRPESAYLGSRRMGDEERYVMDRRAAGGHIGNMMQRPSLFVEPWSAVETATSENHLAAGGEFGHAFGKVARAGERSSSVRGGASYGDSRLAAPPSLAFMAEPSVVQANLKPDKDGVVCAKLDLGGRQELIAVATDAGRTARRICAVGEATDFPKRDLRAAAGASGVTMNVQTALAAGAAWTPTDKNAAWRAYTGLREVHELFQAAGTDDTFGEFAFVTRWASFKDAEKDDLYSRYACHELDFFLYHKDRAFFGRVAKPAIAAKRVKDLVDTWLLGDDLSPWLRPEKWTKLNAFEKALTGKAARYLADECARRYSGPETPWRDDQDFETALRNQPIGLCGRTVYSYAAVKGGDEEEKLEELEPPPDVACADAVAPAPRSMGVRGMFVGKAKASGARFANDLAARKAIRRMWAPPDRTREWRETYYWKKLPASAQADDISPDRFLAELAAAGGRKTFLPVHLMDAAHGGFTERMVALAILDLPLNAETQSRKEAGSSSAVTGPALVFVRQSASASDRASGPARAAHVSPSSSSSLVLIPRFSEPGAKDVAADGSERDRILTDEFIPNVPCSVGAKAINMTGTKASERLTLRIPEGAVALGNGPDEQSATFLLNAYEGVDAQPLAFYFPSGPARTVTCTATAGGALGDVEASRTFQVVPTATKTDLESWAHVADSGTDEEVLKFLAERNLAAPSVNLNRIAWRMQDKAFFEKATAAITARGRFDVTLWGYALKHHDAARTREYLASLGGWEKRCGLALESPILSYQAETDGLFEHLEYWPLVNTRAHAVGGGWFIANTALAAQYRRFLDTLAYKPILTGEDNLAATVYLLAMDRIGEAEARFVRVKRGEVTETAQYDYAAAWLALSEGKEPRIPETKNMTKTWRDRFAALKACYEGKSAELEVSGATECVLALEPDGAGGVKVTSMNVDACELRFHPVDLELLFSKRPFDLADSKSAATAGAVTRPVGTQTVKLGAGDHTEKVPLPKKFARECVLVEAVSADGKARAETMVTPKTFEAKVVSSRGLVKVTGADGKPVAGAYVKVYARGDGEDGTFHKDGYTDVRGFFDYASISTDSPFTPKDFAILVITPTQGACVLIAPSPAR